MRGHIDHLPLIGRDRLIELGVLISEQTGSLKETNEPRIKHVSGINELKFKKELIREDKDAFQGMGKVERPKTGKVVAVGFKMGAGIQPIAEKSRHVPYHQEFSLKKWI